MVTKVPLEERKEKWVSFDFKIIDPDLNRLAAEVAAEEASGKPQ
jgi:hypothetical protein